MPAAQLNVHQQLISVIKKFKFEELESTVLPQFPETSWNEMRSRLVKHHETFTVSNVMKMIERAIIKEKIDEKELHERLTLLEVIEISRHYTKKFWYAYELMGRDAVEELTNNKMRQNIIQSCDTLRIKMEVKFVNNDGITFMAMREKKSKRLLPTFFAIFPELGYFFCARKNPSKDLIHCLIEGTGHTEAKRLKLVGRDLKSLIKMLQMKKRGVIQSNALCNSPVYNDAKPIFKNTGIDFRQHQQRKNYAEQCFGNEPPILDAVVVKNSGMHWADKEIAAKLPNSTINIEWEFKSHHIANLLTHLAEKRILVNPLPNYVAKLMESGKTDLKIKN